VRAREDALKLEVTRKCSVLDIESMLAQVQSSSAPFVDIWLSRDVGAALFIESRITALFATAARSHKVRVVDWAQSGVSGYNERFGSKVEGIAALQYASQTCSAQKVKVPISIEEIRSSIETREGIAETVSDGRSMTYCAFDGDVPQQPLAFARVSDKADFRSEFVARFARAFQKDPNIYNLNVDTPIHRLADFVYELFENSFRHGCLDEAGNVIPGFRFFRVQRHPSFPRTRWQFARRARGFSALQNYFNKVPPKEGKFSFYEISISDQGLGIVDRFVASRSDYQFTEDAARSDGGRLFEIIEKALSSKLHQAGAGHGIERALGAITELKGFVSIRFGSTWLFSGCSMVPDASSSVDLQPVISESNFAKIAGTHINIIIVAD
jgi:hypothetical protein